MRSRSSWRKTALRTNQLVARQAAGGDQHDQHAVIRQQQKSHVLDHAARQRRRNKNSQAARNGRKHVAGALHHRFGRLRGFEFPANPLAVFGAGRRLRRNLLDEKPVRRSRGHAPGGGMRLVEIAALLRGPPSRCAPSPSSAARCGAARRCATKPARRFRCSRAPRPSGSAGAAFAS